MIVDGLVAIAEPAKVTVTLELAVKPVPIRETDVPTGLVVGLIEIDVIIVNVAEAELELASVAVIVLLPIVEAGAEKVVLKEPLASVFTVAGVVVTAVPANIIVTVEEAANPLPEREMDVPTGPIVGLFETDVVIVKVAIAVLWLMLLSIALTV